MIILTHRAEQCLKVLHALDRRELLMAEAAELLGRSVRQARRLRAAFRARGLAALVHGNRGRPPVNRIADSVRARVVRLATKIYVGVNDHHLKELLGEREGLTLSRPCPQEGLLVQLDGKHPGSTGAGPS